MCYFFSIKRVILKKKKINVSFFQFRCRKKGRIFGNQSDQGGGDDSGKEEENNTKNDDDNIYFLEVICEFNKEWLGKIINYDDKTKTHKICRQ